MRPLRKLPSRLLYALRFVLASIIVGVVGNMISDWGKDQPDVIEWKVQILLFCGLLLTIDAALSWREKETPEQSGLTLRGRLRHRVLEFAQDQFDGGLYAKARQEFHLGERPLRVTARDNTIDIFIEPYYRRLRSPLVILGAPGTGKTTLLHELAVSICSVNELDPIPVPFSLSNWTREEKSLTEWMADELWRNYGVSSSLAKEWVDKEVIVPFLDGLDEVPGGKRDRCLKKINEYRDAHPDVKFVLTCREEEFKSFKKSIRLEFAVVVGTLKQKDVTAYLESNAPKFDGLRHALEKEPMLWQLMDTPLMLWVGAFAFARETDMDSSGVQSLRERLFDRYVDAMLKRDRSQSAYALDDRFTTSASRMWLQQTATCMTRAGVFSFHLEDLGPEWLPAETRAASIRIVRVVGGLLGGLLSGLIFGLNAGLIFGLNAEVTVVHCLVVALSLMLVTGQVAGLIVGLVFALMDGLLGARAFGVAFGWLIWLQNALIHGPAFFLAGRFVGGWWKKAEPVDVVKWSSRRAIATFLKIVLFGLMFGVVLALLRAIRVLPIGLVVMPVVGVEIGLVIGVILGLAGGLVTGLAASTVQERTGVNSGLKRSALYSSLAVVSSLLLVALPTFLPRFLIPPIALAESILAPVLWLRMGGGFCAKNITMRWILLRTKCIPWRYEVFLFSSAYRALMIKQGGSFRFIHRALQEHLAGHAYSATSSRSSAQ